MRSHFGPVTHSQVQGCEEGPQYCSSRVETDSGIRKSIQPVGCFKTFVQKLMALIDKVPGELKLHIGGCVMQNATSVTVERDCPVTQNQYNLNMELMLTTSVGSSLCGVKRHSKRPM